MISWRNQLYEKQGENALFILSLIFFALTLGWAIKLLNLFLEFKNPVSAIINILIYFISLLLITSFSAMIIKKIVLFKNLKPTLKQKEIKLLVKKLSLNNKKFQKSKNKRERDKLFKIHKEIIKKLESQQIIFENWFVFFIFSLTFMIWMTPFFWTIKQISLSIIPMIKNNFSKNKKKPLYSIVKMLDNKGKETVYQIHFYPN